MMIYSQTFHVKSTTRDSNFAGNYCRIIIVHRLNAVITQYQVNLIVFGHFWSKFAQTHLK